MDISGEVATIIMKTDAKNRVTTARTIHLPEKKGYNPHDFYVAKRSLFRECQWSCLPGAEHLHTTENDVFFQKTLKVSLAPTPQEGPHHVMFVRNQHRDELDELNTCELEGQDATKLTCRTGCFGHRAKLLILWIVAVFFDRQRDLRG